MGTASAAAQPLGRAPLGSPKTRMGARGRPLAIGKNSAAQMTMIRLVFSALLICQAPGYPQLRPQAPSGQGSGPTDPCLDYSPIVRFWPGLVWQATGNAGVHRLFQPSKSLRQPDERRPTRRVIHQRRFQCT